MSLQIVRHNLMTKQQGELMFINVPWGLSYQCSCLYSELQSIPTSTGGHIRSLDSSCPGSCGSTALCWVSVHMRPCVHPPRVEEAETLLILQFSSVQSLRLNRSTPGLPVHHHLTELTQTHIHRVRDAIQPSHPLSSPFPPAPNPSQHQSLFQ